MSDEVTAFDPHASLPGSTVGPWLILGRMDWGNFGIVYRARRAGHPDSPPVVVKMARQPRDPRFEWEVELLQHNPHPSIPRFEDAGLWTSPEGHRYFFTWRFRKDLEARWQAQPTDDLYSLGVAFYRMVTGLYLPSLSEGGEVAATREVPPPSDYATLSMDLEALLLRLLSNEREQRGTAEALAREAAALATAAGGDADMPILPTASARGTDEGGPSSDGLEDEEVLSDTDETTGSLSAALARQERGPRHEPLLALWLSYASVVAVGGLLVFLGWEMHRTSTQQEPAPPWIATPEEVAQFAPDAGVGDEAVSSIQDVPQIVLPALPSFGRPMPKTPLHGQRKPPCERGEREINGGCWVGPIGDETPPCGDTMVDYEGRCYKASVDMPRQPTSDPP